MDTLHLASCKHVRATVWHLLSPELQALVIAAERYAEGTSSTFQIQQAHHVAGALVQQAYQARLQVNPINLAPQARASALEAAAEAVQALTVLTVGLRCRYVQECCLHATTYELKAKAYEAGLDPETVSTLVKGHKADYFAKFAA